MFIVFCVARNVGLGPAVASEIVFEFQGMSDVFNLGSLGLGEVWPAPSPTGAFGRCQFQLKNADTPFAVGDFDATITVRYTNVFEQTGSTAYHVRVSGAQGIDIQDIKRTPPPIVKRRRE